MVVDDTGLGVSGSPCLPVRWFSYSLCFPVTFYFESTLGCSMFPKAEWEGWWFSYIFPCFADAALQCLVLSVLNFSRASSTVYYVFLLIYLSFADCGCSPFSFCYNFFFFPLLSLALEILFRCLGWLLVPVVFLLLPKFFCERSTEIGHRRLQLSFRLYCCCETLGKAVSFLGSSLLAGGCGLHSFLGLFQH